jgi:hypothetical protein
MRREVSPVTECLRVFIFLEVGVAYVRFAVRHRAHFEVMYRPELYRPDDPQVRQARAAAAVLLYGTASPDAGRLAAGAAAWSLVMQGIAEDALDRLARVLGDEAEDRIHGVPQVVGLHLDVHRAAADSRRAPVHEDARVRQRVSLALGAG